MTGLVGPRGLTILVIVGIAGMLLAIVGWTQRGTGPARTAGIAVVSSVHVATGESAR